ncbi:MAG: metallophosphoesterase [Deltaproteobacteria bacterium]|nr:metallophosphoesterase [Kofleriaceae bacterium]
MRLAHCSDLHLLSLDGARALDFASKRWIGGMNLLTNRGRHYHTEAFEDMVEDLNASGVDHLVCTGDVTNLALEQEFRFARARFDKLTLGPSGVTVLPGNHDAYVDAGRAYFTTVFADYCTTDPGWEWSDGDPSPWPLVRVRGAVAIIGLSTSHQTPWFTAYGRAGERQLDRLAAALADHRLRGLCRVVAIHHPPAGRRAESVIRGFRDRERFAAILAEHGAELVVHGHEHRDLRVTLPTPTGTVDILGVPSGTYEASRPEKTARYRIFEIEDGKVISHHLRVWHRDRRIFERDDHEPAARAASA